ncbi:hypothetical protein PTNB29_06598 [Pyrenophora teres f. teres]|nr:hypothetical protein PTNB29_06598 [Pyrenophora teres f. teres]
MMSQSQQLTKWKRPHKKQFDAIFYPRAENLTTFSLLSDDMRDPLYAITSLVNNMPLSSDANSNNACAVFGSLPLDALSQILKNLPNLVFDALREWVFVAAAQAGQVGIMLAMLQLNVDPFGETMMDQGSPPKSICSLDLQSLQKLPKAMTSNLTSWIQAGLLVHCIENLATESSIALRYVFESFEKDITPRDLNLRSALLSAMEAGVWWNKSAAPVNLEAFYILGYVFNDYLLFPTGLSVQKNAAREFCEKEDWDSAASFVVIVDPEVHSKSIEEYEVQAKRWKEAKKAIEEAIMEKNLEKAWGYLKQCSDPAIAYLRYPLESFEKWKTADMVYRLSS